MAPRNNWRYAIAVILPRIGQSNIDNKITKAKFDYIKTGFFAI